MDDGRYYNYGTFLVEIIQINDGKVSLRLLKSAENSGNFVSPPLWPPCTCTFLYTVDDRIMFIVCAVKQCQKKAGNSCGNPMSGRRWT